MPVTYDELNLKQRCIYQALSQSHNISETPQEMAKYVNDKNVDADDNKAMVILARKYNFIPRLGSLGSFFNNETRHEANAELIVVIAGGSDAMVLGGRFPVKSARFADEILWCKEKRIDKINWHAIYAKTNGNGGIAYWNDFQAERTNGPWNGDYVVYFEKIS